MKKVLFVLSAIFCLAMVQTVFAQNITLKFKGATNDGKYVQLDSVRVENISRSWIETLVYPDTVLSFSFTGIGDAQGHAINNELVSFPNPFDGTTHISLTLSQNEAIALQVYNIAGQRIMDKRVQAEAGENLFEISLQHTQVYFLIVNTSNGRLVQKLINLGNSGDNSIAYIGTQQTTETIQTKTQKLLSAKEFQSGDILRIRGFVTHNGNVVVSNEILQLQTASENFTLFFTLQASASLPTLSTTVASNITKTTATSGGNITSDGGATVTARGVCWSTSQNPTISNSHTTDGNGIGSFTSSITGLTAGTTYYVRAYATNSTGTAYGNQITFTTTANTPTLTTTAASNVTGTTAISGGNITSDGGSTVTARGVCWSTSQNPTVSNSHTTDGNGIGSFTSSITGLTAGTTYYVRAYATNSAGTAYGNQITFTTTANTPTLTTTAASNVTGTTATSGGNITSDGGATVTARGVCWSTSSNPTISNSHTTNGSGTGSFTSSITGLTAGTTYYVRAYATNSAGTAYGNQITFTTTANTPTLTTTAASNVTGTTATSGGNITSDGGAIVTARGVCWSTSQNPTISNSHTTNGSGTGSFTSNITGLTAGTTYYVRAYATNSAGTAYGNQVSFATTADANLPTVITSNLSNLTFTQATLGGNVTDYGNSAVTARGICWANTPNPTISNSHTSDGIGSGTFTSVISNWVAGTTYYVRAYATNSAGTAYGNQVIFNAPSINNATNAYFSVSSTKKVYFSSGNLQWSAKNGGSTATTHAVMGGGTAAGTWRFAPNQGVTIGSSNTNISSTYSGWIDLFGWGTSGYNNKYPYMTSSTSTDYGSGTNPISGTNYDWGLYNAIYNPHTNTTDAPGTWRTLTKDEWVYLMNTRSTSSGVRYAKANVMGTNGVIIVPDNWSTSVYTLKSTNTTNANYTANTINYTNWIKMENAGCVFLPAAGSRNGASVSNVGSRGSCWSGTYYTSDYAYYLFFYSSDLLPSDYGNRHIGYSVRLVRSAQ